MCTVSWRRLADGYELFCNRDERHTRQPALAPDARSERGVRFLAPRDGDLGGTWIAVNELGLTASLLNRWQDQAAPVKGPDAYRSRGWLVDDLAPCADTVELGRRLAEQDLADYRAFTLVALEPGKPTLVADWNGKELLVARDGDARLPLVSSSFETDRVRESRRALFAEMTRGREVTRELLESFHSGHGTVGSRDKRVNRDKRGDAFSVCMHRDDASTKSFSRIRVGAAEVSFSYAPGAPCQVSFLEPVSLARVAHTAPHRN